eukprot:GEMP01033269.1.p1 GENE.GEMP01033269.1~~GEMP01033269.1.p1  ORF type:complete len:230 (+),score=30.09 GEMP01033269.1:124-813(+)
MRCHREDYIGWDDYFMAVAVLSAMRSKDPSTQVGACIVDDKKRIVGIGYNGFPSKVSDDDLPWLKTGSSAQETKYPYVCHAELNALLNSNGATGTAIYTSLFPCHECSKLVIQAGIKEVVFLSDKHRETKSNIASRRMLDLAGVRYRKIAKEMDRIEVNIKIIAESAPTSNNSRATKFLLGAFFLTACALNFRKMLDRRVLSDYMCTEFAKNVVSRSTVLTRITLFFLM